MKPLARGAAAAPPAPRKTKRSILVVPGIGTLAASATSAGYGVKFARKGIARRLLLGVAHGDPTSSPYMLDCAIKIAGGSDLFNNGTAGDYINVGLLMAPSTSSSGAPLGGGVGLVIERAVEGNELWTFQFRNVSGTAILLPRAAIIVDEFL